MWAEGEGKRRRGRPRETWRHTWGATVASASDRDGWRDLLAVVKGPHGLDEDK